MFGFISDFLYKRELNRCNKYSSQLEEDTGYTLLMERDEDGIKIYLIDPYGDLDRSNSDYWTSLDDAMFDLSDLQGLCF